MKKSLRRRYIITSALLAGAIMFSSSSQLIGDLASRISLATEGNVVYFNKTTTNENNSIVYVDLMASGTPGDTIVVNYSTSSGTAIENVDYSGVNNSVSLTLNQLTGTATYTIAVKCLNDSNTREKIRVMIDDVNYGRYFNLTIVNAINATIKEEAKTCKCYLSFDNIAEGEIGKTDAILGDKNVYLKDYKNMISLYNKGLTNLDGKSTWKTWKNGMNFNNETSQRWMRTYIEKGLANAYGSFVASNVDDTDYFSTSNISVLFGNKEFIDKYERDDDCPGLLLYFESEPCAKGGYKFDGRAMYYVANDINPRGEDGTLLDIVDMNYNAKEKTKRIYWIQETDAWYSSKNSIYDTMFYRIDPYNGILDQGVAFFNGNKEWDREVKNVWMFMSLFDDKCPEIVGEYAEYNKANDSIRISLRFSEPVYSSKNGLLTVRINSNTSSTKYYANYVEGNYSDTLVYEVPSSAKVPNIKVASVYYELPSGDICDMAYKLNKMKIVEHNYLKTTEPVRQASIVDGLIDLSVPSIVVDIPESASPKNVHNVMISTNGKGATQFDEGTVYYSWSKSESIANPTNVTSYDFTHVLTTEEQGSFPVTLTKNEGVGIDSGNYYLHVLVVTRYGSTFTNHFGPYLLDGDIPVVEQLIPEINELQNKVFKLDIKNKPLKTKTNSIVANLDYKVGISEEQKSSSLTLMENGSIVSSLKNIFTKETTEDGIVYSYNSNIAEDAEYKDTFILGLIGDDTRLDANISFEVTDEAGNTTRSNSFRTIYDSRPNFENTYVTSESYVEDKSITISDSVKVYNIHEAAAEDGITFSLKNNIEKELVDAGAIYSLIVNGDEVFGGTGEHSVKIKNLKPGFYEVTGHLSGMAAAVEVDKVSKTTTFYLTDNMTENTTNKNNATTGNLVLNNHVYQLEDARYYYYNNSNAGVSSHLYGGTYNQDTGQFIGGSAYPTFSNNLEAKKYVKYMEYQDIELISITDTIATLLNSGTGSTVYVKAPKETKTAQAGQLWIRYKRSTWTTSANTNGWAFYYYGEGKVESGVNINGLSPNLNSAIDTVVSRIVSGGKDIYLVQDENLNRVTGAPYLSDTQLHVERESAAYSKSGTKFATEAFYAGDSEIYNNKVAVGENKYPLATNLSLSIDESTTLYFKDANSDKWTKIETTDGTLLKDALADQVTGLFTIREYDKNGIGEFTVYLDKTLPTVTVLKDEGIEESQAELVLDEVTASSPISCTTLKIDSLVAEADDLAYVAIYGYPRHELITVLYAEQVNNPESKYLLTNGNYFIQVGDRSGNVLTFTVLTSSSDIDLSITQNESKTSVIVTVSNRTDSEIYSYEVYLNETLIETEFSNKRVYREAGAYRVDVVDIYGKVATASLVYAAPTPNLTWYYMNDEGDYSKYDPNKTGRLILQDDPNNSRITNVYGSSLVRIKLESSYNDSAVEFELTNIESESYTYNKSTGVLTINSLSSWSLRVWYSGEPENDHVYTFYLDNQAPEINASFIGTSFQQYVVYDDGDNVVITSTFDIANFDSYEVGDHLTLDTLQYEKTGSATLEFASGAVISAQRITISLSDNSGIKDVEVTRNGQKLEIKPDADNKMTLTSYGTYIIKVTDNLSNVSTFIFTNVETDITGATIDGEILNQDVLNYGHENLEVVAYYEGENTVLVKTEKGSYAYLFTYENGEVRFGSYVIVQDTEPDDKGVYHNHSEYEQVKRFIIDASGVATKLNTWYVAVENDYFVIDAMIDDNKMAHYRVRPVSSAIEVETRFSVGNVHLPNRYIVSLSKENPTLVLLTGEEVVEKQGSGDYIYISKDLTVDKEKVSETITKIDFAYSTTPEFGELATVYEQGQWVGDLVGVEYGFYKIVVTNVFGNETVYLIDKITAFASVVTVTCTDGHTIIFYSNEEGRIIRSNYMIELKVMSDQVYFEINEVRTSGVISDGMATLSLKGSGKYSVKVVGFNGISEKFEFEIGLDDSFIYDTNWIVGYNPNALLEEHTNTMCSVKTDPLDPRIVYVEMIVNDERRIVLYDNVSENKKTDLDMLANAIGGYGIGKYVVEFRDAYGDLVSHTVYYNNIASLQLTRVITSDPLTYQEYDLEFAVEKDFYSNYVLCFSTTSEVYQFTVDGVRYSLDEMKKIEFSNLNGNGSFSYAITYLDEYGNYVEFNAVLYRNDVAFDASSMEIITVGTKIYTRDDICIFFEDGLKATLSVDGGETKDYLSGEVRYADGEYLFTIRDIAGNKVFYTINHKSVNHYSLTNSSSGEAIFTGGVINDASVVFHADDGSKIKYIVRNGELVTDYNSNTFNLTGHYELLIEDDVGNCSYEEFYIINNSLCTFTYVAPFDYEVSEVWRNGADGSREQLNVRGPSVTLNANGDYVVVVSSTKTPSSFNFTITIDNSKPTATLSGAEDGGVTARDVTLTGLKTGDVVRIYKDGVLVSTTTISLSSDLKPITDGGKYRVTVTNIQGVTEEYNFTRKATTNVAGSIFIIVSSSLLVVGIGIGLIYHTKLKTDD